MTLKECYTALGGDYESAVGRLISEKLVQKFVIKFPDDPSYDNLHKSLENKIYDEAFRAAHTIKGVCQNLSFTKLFDSSSRLTEALRAGAVEDISNLVTQVDADYRQTVSAIKTFQNESV